MQINGNKNVAILKYAIGFSEKSAKITPSIGHFMTTHI